MNDLATAPEGYEIPPRPKGAERGKRTIGNTILVARGDFEIEPMEATTKGTTK